MTFSDSVKDETLLCMTSSSVINPYLSDQNCRKLEKKSMTRKSENLLEDADADGQF